jgi:hypothetical protein
MGFLLYSVAGLAGKLDDVDFRRNFELTDVGLRTGSVPLYRCYLLSDPTALPTRVGRWPDGPFPPPVASALATRLFASSLVCLLRVACTSLAISGSCNILSQFTFETRPGHHLFSNSIAHIESFVCGNVLARPALTQRGPRRAQASPRPPPRAIGDPLREIGSRGALETASHGIAALQSSSRCLPSRGFRMVPSRSTRLDQRTSAHRRSTRPERAQQQRAGQYEAYP